MNLIYFPLISSIGSPWKKQKATQSHDTHHADQRWNIIYHQLGPGRVPLRVAIARDIYQNQEIGGCDLSSRQ